MAKYIVLITFIILSACKSEVSQQAYQNVTVPELFKTAAKHKDPIFLDVRTDAEVAEGKVPAAIQIDFRADDFAQKIEQLDPNETYFVYCKSGGRSSKAAALMKTMGFKTVYNIEGGYQAINNHPLLHQE